MSLKKARELEIEVVDIGSENEFIEQWTKGETRIEVRNVKTPEIPVASHEHYIRKVNIRNGKTIWVSEMYHNRSSARRAAVQEFIGRE